MPKKVFPLHIRGAIYFLFSRKRCFTEKDLTEKEYLYLQNVIRQPGNIDYCFWKTNLPIANTLNEIKKEKNKKTKIVFLPLPEQFFYFLGKCEVSEEDSFFVIKDFYQMNPKLLINFNNYIKETLYMARMFFINKAILYSILFRILNLKHLFGYKGFNVRIRLCKKSFKP
jgi:hypothetical protein